MDSAVKGRISINDPRIQMASLRGTLTIPQIVHTSDIGKTIILVDDYGNEIVAVLSDEEVTLDATPNDIRIGKTAATADGLTLGEKVIPSYYVAEGYAYIPVGSEFSFLNLDDGYTKLQALICKFNSSTPDSVSTEKVSINGKVYETNSTKIIATVSVRSDEKKIYLGLDNDSDSPCILRYFMYKEIY